MEDTPKDSDATPVDEFISDAESIDRHKNDIDEEQSKSSHVLNMSAELSKDLDNRDKKTDIWLKRGYGIAILFVLGYWEWFVIDVVKSQLNPNVEEMFHLSDAVLIALLTSATANILTLPTIILSYLFPKKK